MKHGTTAAKDEFWRAVYSSNEVEYEKHAKILKELQDDGTDRKAYDDFVKQEPKRLCRAFLSTTAKSDSVESNVCESLNNAITRFRDLRIIKLLEGIRSYIMVRMVDQHKSFTAMRDVICLTILEPIEWTKIEVRTCVIQPTMSYMRYDIKGYVDRLSWLRKLTQRAFHHYLDVRIGLKLRAYRHCGQADHNVRGCKMTPEDAANLPKPPPPKPVGRPRRRPIQEPHLDEENDQSGAGVRIEEVEQPGTQPPNTQPRSSR
ncbi:hypothetical protein LINPERHAP2_LOCUS4765 [Linum perenne]